MGIIGFDPIPVPHYCHEGRPVPWNYEEGTLWQCDGCPKRYRVETVRDRGISAREWVIYK